MLAPLNPNVGQDHHNARYLATACDLAYLPAAEGCRKFQEQLGL